MTTQDWIFHIWLWSQLGSIIAVLDTAMNLCIAIWNESKQQEQSQ